MMAVPGFSLGSMLIMKVLVVSVEISLIGVKHHECDAGSIV